MPFRPKLRVAASELDVESCVDVDDMPSYLIPEALQAACVPELGVEVQRPPLFPL